MASALTNTAFRRAKILLAVLGPLTVALFGIETIVNAAHSYFIFSAHSSALAGDAKGAERAVAAWLYLIRNEHYDYFVAVGAIGAFLGALFALNRCRNVVGKAGGKFRRASLLLTLILLISFVTVRLTTDAIDAIVTSATSDQPPDVAFRLQLWSALKASAFLAATASIGMYLLRQWRNIRRVQAKGRSESLAANA